MKESMVGMDDVTVKLLVDMHIAQGDLAAVRVTPHFHPFSPISLNSHYMTGHSVSSIRFIH